MYTPIPLPVLPPYAMSRSDHPAYTQAREEREESVDVGVGLG